MATKEQWVEWRHHPVTEEVFEELRAVVEHEKERLAKGGTLNEENVAAATSRVVGRIEGFEFLLNADYEDEDTESLE